MTAIDAANIKISDNACKFIICIYNQSFCTYLKMSELA